MISPRSYEFPAQKVSAAEKEKPNWYANSIDYIISLGESMNDRSEVETKLNILHGNMPNEFYTKTLNPYNTSQERFKYFPATLRNYDIMSDIVRRYVGEYFKGAHEFVVGANNPDIVLNRNAALKKKVLEAAEKAFQQEFQKRYQQMVQQAQANGQTPDSVNPQNAMPNAEEFIEKFNQDYIDKESKQGQEILNYIRDITDDTIIYLTNFFNYCSLGECYSYSEIRNNKIYKESVPVVEAYPIPNNKMMVEDHDMFARKIMMSYNQILDLFDDELDDNDRAYLEKYYSNYLDKSPSRTLTFKEFYEYYASTCDKFSKEERNFFKQNNLSPYEKNSNLFFFFFVV